MDIILSQRKGRIPRSVWTTGGIIILCVLAAWALRSLTLQRSVVTVDRATLITDSARRGTLIESVSASGIFEPKQIRIVSTTQEGIVQQILVKPGTRVEAGSVIAIMDNPMLDANVLTAQAKVEVARANVVSAREQARAAELTQESALANAQALLRQSELEAQSLSSLHAKGLVTDHEYRSALIDLQKSQTEVANDKAQLAVATAQGPATIAAAQAELFDAQAQLTADRQQVAALTVHAGAPGIVQSVAVDPGMHAGTGTELARVANLTELKVVLQVPEAQVDSITSGMPVIIDTGNGYSSGTVAHIAPRAENGTVAVDVFPLSVPVGARPNANVDGTVEISRIPKALSIARPAGALDNSTVDLFKVIEGGLRAVRVRVRFGRGSNDRIQVLSGLSPGDTVIVSDMSAYQDQTEVHLH